MEVSKNYYKILQVDPSADPEIITAAYRRLALKYHPDTNKSPEATRKMQGINEAYGVLNDLEARARYDQERKKRPQARAAAYRGQEERSQRGEAEGEQSAQADRHGQAEAKEAHWREGERQRRDEAEVERNWAAYERLKRDGRLGPTEPVRSDLNRVAEALAVSFIVFVVFFFAVTSWGQVGLGVGILAIILAFYYITRGE